MPCRFRLCCLPLPPALPARSRFSYQPITLSANQLRPPQASRLQVGNSMRLAIRTPGLGLPGWRCAGAGRRRSSFPPFVVPRFRRHHLPTAPPFSYLPSCSCRSCHHHHHHHSPSLHHSFPSSPPPPPPLPLLSRPVTISTHQRPRPSTPYPWAPHPDSGFFKPIVIPLSHLLPSPLPSTKASLSHKSHSPFLFPFTQLPVPSVHPHLLVPISSFPTAFFPIFHTSLIYHHTTTAHTYTHTTRPPLPLLPILHTAPILHTRPVVSLWINQRGNQSIPQAHFASNLRLSTATASVGKNLSRDKPHGPAGLVHTINSYHRLVALSRLSLLHLPPVPSSAHRHLLRASTFDRLPILSRPVLPLASSQGNERHTHPVGLP